MQFVYFPCEQTRTKTIGPEWGVRSACARSEGAVSGFSVRDSSGVYNACVELGTEVRCVLSPALSACDVAVWRPGP